MQTDITRAGDFRDVDAQACESKLRHLGGQGYLTDDGIRLIFPDGLTPAQLAEAEATLNAHVAITDNDRLTPLQKLLLAYLTLNNPSAAQRLLFERTVAKMLLRLTYDRERIGNTDLET